MVLCIHLCTETVGASCISSLEMKSTKISFASFICGKIWGGGVGVVVNSFLVSLWLFSCINKVAEMALEVKKSFNECSVSELQG